MEHCVKCVGGFIAAGVDHVTIRPIGNDLSEQLRIYLKRSSSLTFASFQLSITLIGKESFCSYEFFGSEELIRGSALASTPVETPAGNTMVNVVPLPISLRYVIVPL